jgi:site-specific DNA-methyltransferase (adenine-specific)
MIIHGDCLEELPKIADKSIDMILTDLPYGTTACKWDNIIPFEPMWKEVKRVIKDNGCIALFGSQPFTSKLIMSNIKMFKYQWIWIKNRPTGFLTAKYMPMKGNEEIVIFGLRKINYYPIMVKRTFEEFKQCYRKNNSKTWGNNIQGLNEHPLIRKSEEEQWFKNPTNILNIKVPDDRNVDRHPTQKPIKLLEYLIETYTKENETVLDFTMGSGSTGVACIQTRRKFIGIEQDKGYFEIAKKRIDQACYQGKLF